MDALFSLSSPVLFLSIGLVFLIRGWYLRRRAFAPPPPSARSVDHLWWNRLAQWQVISPSPTQWGVVQAFARYSDRLNSSAALGAGLAIMLAWLVGGSLSMLWKESQEVFSTLPWFVLQAALYLSCLIGYGLGYAYEVWRLRRTPTGAQQITYGDLRARRLADYRSGVFLWGAGLLLVEVILTTLVLLLRRGPGAPVTLGGVGGMTIPVWTLAAVPVAMLLTFGIGETIMAQMVRLPRLFLTATPQTAQRADNVLRAITIGVLQGWELVVLGTLAASMLALLPPHSPLLELAALLSGVVMCSGFCLPACAGRIGGTLTGWPWHPAEALS